MRVAPPGLWSRDFGLFFTARTVAKFGDMMLPVALAAGLIRHGGGVAAVGASLASFTACFAGSVLLGGVIADRFDARTLMIGADLARVGLESVAAALFLTGHVVLWQVCAVSAVNGACAGMFQPGVVSTVPRVARDVRGANGAIRTAESCMAILAPAVAGVLVGLAAVWTVFAAHAATYLVSAVCLLLLRLPPAHGADGDGGGADGDGSGADGDGGGADGDAGAGAGAAPGTFRAELAEGWREVRGRPWLWGGIAIWMVFVLAVWGPAVPLAATEIITAHGERAYGAVSSALGVGMATGGLLAMRLRPRRPLRAGAVALFGFCLHPAAIGGGLPVGMIMAGCVVAGAALAFWSVMWATSVQTGVPGPVLNRIHAYEMAGSVSMMPIGQGLAGPASAAFGAHEILLTGAVVSVATSGSLLAVPAIRDLLGTDPAGAPPGAPPGLASAAPVRGEGGWGGAVGRGARGRCDWGSSRSCPGSGSRCRAGTRRRGRPGPGPGCRRRS
nr:MFS transporter [Streptomyces sp. NBC_01803]